MANRRMFSLDVVDTDRFLDMPATTQLLYFHLGMRADDDGFVSSPRRISNYVGCNEDDLKLLIAKGFIIQFENGVIVIKDWLVNNTLRHDRYRETVHQEEYAALTAKKGKSYEISKSIQDGCQMVAIQVDKLETQDRLSKDRLGKDRINYQEIVNMYNDTCVSFPKVQTLSENRKKAIKARFKQYAIDDFKRLFEMAEQSDFLKGSNNRNWSANFDWLIKDSNMAKVLEGNYTNRAAGQTGVAPVQPEDPPIHYETQADYFPPDYKFETHPDDPFQ